MGSPHTCMTASYASQAVQFRHCRPGVLLACPELIQYSAHRGIPTLAPHKAAPSTMPPPALAATPWRPTLGTARSVGKGKAPPPTLVRVPECRHLSNKKIRDLTKAAQREGDYSSHTDRYRRDHLYAARCKAVQPYPTPEWLQYTSCEWAREDGEEINPPSVHSNASSSSRGRR